MNHLSTRSKDYSNLLHDIIENELNSNLSNNESLWSAMGTELEIQGVEKTQISTIVRKDIEDILYEKQYKEFIPREEYHYNNSTYFKVMRKNGWTDPFMARHINLDPPLDQHNSSIYTQNLDMMLLCDDVINICRTIKEKAKECNSLEDTFGKKDMREFYRQRNTILENCKNAIDNKTKVPKNTELFLLECLATVLGNTNKCAQVFMEYNFKLLKEQNKFLTLKQATKFQKGGKQSQLLILKPVSRDTAIFLDYTGIQCTCESWRVNDYTCYDCDKKINTHHISKCNHCQIPLYKERLLHIVKTNKCENCDETVDLPEELIQYAKS